MESMELIIRIAGALMVCLALMHIIFPRYFKWDIELQQLSLVNRQIMQVHTFFVALVVFLMGVLCMTSTQDLIETNLGKVVSLGFGVFWFARLVIQFVGYSSELWRGKMFETLVHIAFSFLWIFFSGVFISNYFSSNL